MNKSIHALIGVVLVFVSSIAIAAKSDPTLDKLVELDKLLQENRNKLENFEKQAEELIRLLNKSEEKRALLQKEFNTRTRTLEKLIQQEREIKQSIARLEKGLQEARKSGHESSAWALSLGRTGNLELILNPDDPATQLRKLGLLRATLSNVQRQTLKLDDNLQQLTAQKSELDANKQKQIAKRQELQKSGKVLDKQRTQINQTLKTVKGDQQLTATMIADLEQAKKELARILAKSKRRRSTGTSSEKLGRQLAPPLQGDLYIAFGSQMDPVFGVEIEHPGWTWKVATGTPVIAVANGEVVYAGWLRGYGNLIVLQHDDEHFTLYGHLDDLFAKQGDTVSGGAPIALSGDSGSMYGPVLHFEIRRGKEPLDPASWLRSEP